MEDTSTSWEKDVTFPEGSLNGLDDTGSAGRDGLGAATLPSLTDV